MRQGVEGEAEERYEVKRCLYEQHTFEKEFRGTFSSPETRGQKLRKFLGTKCSPGYAVRTTGSFLPVLRWLPKYRPSEYLMADIIAGITVFIVQLPQSIALGDLAGLSPLQGLYASCLPVLFYSILSNARHLSIGPTITTATLLKVILRDTAKHDSTAASSNSTLFINGTSEPLSHPRLDLALAVTAVAGFHQIIMGLSHSQFLFLYLSKPFVNGYLFGNVVYIVILQLATLFGIVTQHHAGVFGVIYFLIDFFEHIKEMNWVTPLLSGISFLLIMFGKVLINPHFQKKVKIPLPSELIVLFIATAVTHYMQLNRDYGIAVVGEFKTGIPMPSLPPLYLAPQVVVSSVTMALISLCFSLTVSHTYADKYKEELDDSQELVALGVSNVVSCVFSGMIVSGSVTRTAIQESVGGKTQVRWSDQNKIINY